MTPSGRARWLLVAVVSALVITAAVASGVSFYSSGPSQTSAELGLPVNAPSPAAPKPITLVQAWNIAENAAKQWQADAALTQLSSSDLDDTPTQPSGVDGTRRTWTAIAMSETTQRRLWIKITDGVVVEATEQDGPLSNPIATKPAIDSPQAVQVASTIAPDLQPGDGKARGIHFVLESGSDGGRPLIRVVGTVAGLPAFVEVDALSGEPVATYQQDYGSNGAVLYSADGGITWHPSNLTGRAVTAVAKDPASASSAYAAVASTSGIEVYGSEDWGATWTRLGQLPAAAGTWPYNIESVLLPENEGTGLLVGSPSGLWFSRDLGATWSRIPGLPSAPAWQVATTAEGTGSTVFVTVVSGPGDAAVYSSRDLTSWKEELPGAFRLSESLDGTSVLAIDETRPAEGLLFGPGRRTAMPLPLTGQLPQDVVLRAAGRFEESSPVIAESPSGVYLSDDGGLTWHKTLEATVASIGLSPDFESSGIGMAGGFRSGIYRTSDGGRTWVRVVDDPSRIGPCSGIISSLLFLTSSNALAVSAPTPVWKAQ